MLPTSEVWAPPGLPLSSVMPLFPIYIPSKGRSSLVPGTIRMLSALHVPFSVVVERPEVELYEERVRGLGGYGRVLTLDPQFQRDYDPCWDLPPDASRGSGPARNFAWEHAKGEGHAYYWCMDDNHLSFHWFYGGRKVCAGDAGPLRYAEELTRRYKNVAMGGLDYFMFCNPKHNNNLTLVNTRVYSCNLIRTDIKQRWRGVYNEDTILSLDMMKAGWNTILTKFAIVNKTGTMRTTGGNTDTIYAGRDAHLRKAQVLVRAHPDAARVITRLNRTHHYVDYRPWQRRLCVPFEDAPPMPRFDLSILDGHWSTRTTADKGETDA